MSIVTFQFLLFAFTSKINTYPAIRGWVNALGPKLTIDKEIKKNICKIYVKSNNSDV